MDKAISNAYKLAKQLDDVEVEARIKGPIVRPDTVRKLLDHHLMRIGKTYIELRNKANSGNQSIIYRSINEENVVCKTKIKSYKCHNEWVSIVVSVEKDTGNTNLLAEKHFVETTKTRYSKKLYNNTMRLDVTHLHDDDTYQVEIEVLKYHSEHQFKECVREIVEILQDSPMYLTRKKFDTVRIAVGGEKFFASSVAFQEDGSDFSMYYNKYQKPVTLTHSRMRKVLGKGMYMTPKFDGVRRFLVTFNGKVYDIDPEYMHVRMLAGGSDQTDCLPIIIDTELVLDTYYAFDVVALNGEYIGFRKFVDRLKELQGCVNMFSKVVKCEIKEYERIIFGKDSNPVDQIAKFYDSRVFDLPIDGLIFTHETWIYTQSVIKWKDGVTIDLYVDEDGEIEERIIANKLEGNFPRNPNGKLLHGAGVYEFEILGVVDDTLDLRIVRFRMDKEKPNASKVIINNVEGFELRKVWMGGSCKFMRQYHNMVKKSALRKICHRGSTVLDLGTGQGGDISKWENVGKVYCVEPNKKAIKELKRRLSEKDEIKKKVQIIRCYASNTEKIFGKVGKVDVVTAFFTLNLFNKEDLKGLSDILSKYKPKDFIGIFLDKGLIQEGLFDPCFSITFGDNAYNIHLFDTRINQREHFLGMNQLTFNGYELVETKPLDYGTMMSENEKVLSGMFRYFHFRLK